MTLHWTTVASVSKEVREANEVIVRKLGLPLHWGAGRLAVVGGGHSIAEHIEELQNWDGAIWAVNGTINWCLDHGIDAAFYTIDASPIERWHYDLSRVRRAVLAPDCDPSLFEYLHRQGADISLTQTPDGGPTTAAASDFLSIQAGYRHVTFFGCEGNFGETSHAYKSLQTDGWIIVEVGAYRFTTKPEFIDQSKIMSEVLREFPEFYAEKSGGMLRTMVAHGPAFDVIKMSPKLLASCRVTEVPA